MQATLAAVSDREVVLKGRHGRKLYFEQLEVKVTPLASHVMHCLLTFRILPALMITPDLPPLCGTGCLVQPDADTTVSAKG